MKGALLKTAACAGLLSIVATGAANAGGFSRGTAPIDLLYEDGNFNIRFDARVVLPHQEYSKNANPALVGSNYYEKYIVPSVGFKFNISDNFRCVGTYTQNNGSSVEYDSPKIVSGKVSENFHTDEFGATCAVRFAVGSGVFSVLGGGFVEELTYNRVTDLGTATGIPFLVGFSSPLKLDGQEYGWRAGLAYEIPDIKLRAELLYRSGTNYGADGTLVVPGALVGAPLPSVTLPATAVGSLPQSVELNVRSGIAEGWLAFGSVRWADWSVLDTLSVTTALSTTVDQYHWRDGWTLTGGVVHAFTDTFAGQISLTWDEGVSTGWDLRGETWTLALGGRVRAPVGGEFRFGAGIAYLASEETTEYADAFLPGNPHSGFNEATDTGYAVGLNVGYIVQW
ncbi:outer membrane protein transport protein [Mesorhizobium sp. BAC0120]|uniref:outer membrane protein transport protein n=1 Tax=Mesorhizobium sp. BAC0120 TaxID=3090670 RepID=UPI00298CE3DE|nr:outer membrane protein transport protein [Mesorhizobium sp. BAC0120]MDW6023977.1 outer membrane protein transport protein [Mesorhizobium sp. BAC0120]